MGGWRQMTLTWTLVPNATQYHYYYNNISTPNIIYGGKSISSINTTAVIEDLSDDVTYSVYVIAYNSSNKVLDKTDTQTITILSDNTTPTTVTDVSAVVLPGQLNVSWNASTNTGPRSSGIWYYILTVTDSSGRTFTRQTTVLAYSLTDLDGNLIYTLKVNAFNRAETASSDSVLLNVQPFLTPDRTVPGTISSVTTTITNVLFPQGGVVNLSWSAATDPAGYGETVSGIKNYNIRYGLVDISFNAVNLTPITTISGASSPYPVFGLTNSTQYWFQIQAVDNANNVGAWSTLVVETPLAPDTTAPPTVRFVATGGDKALHIRWTEVEDTYVPTQIRSGIDKYVIFAYNDNDSSDQYIINMPWYESVAFSDIYIRNTFIRTQGSYWINVAAQDKVGNMSQLGPSQLAISAAPGTGADGFPPSIVTNVQIERGDTQLTINHNDAIEQNWVGFNTAGISYYEYKYTSDGTNYVTITGTNNGTQQIITGLTNGIEYSVQVRAVDNTGNIGAWSEPVVGMPLAPDSVKPQKPLNLTAIAGNTTILLTWTPVLKDTDVSGTVVSGMAGYKITVNGTIIIINNIYTSNYLLTGLTNGTLHNVYINTFDYAGNASTFAGLFNIVPRAPDTTPPPALIVNNYSEGDTNVSIQYRIPNTIWNPISQIASTINRYEIQYKNKNDALYSVHSINTLINTFQLLSTHTISGLKNGQTYMVRARLIDAADNYGAWSYVTYLVPKGPGYNYTNRSYRNYS